VGRPEEWVGSIERGRRQVRRLDILTEVAQALRVTLPDLLGQPVLMEDEREGDDVPAVRDALMAPRAPGPGDGRKGWRAWSDTVFGGLLPEKRREGQPLKSVRA
jgi:hypothetical protein